MYGVRWCYDVFIDVAELCVRVRGVYMSFGGFVSIVIFSSSCDVQS